MNKAILLSKKCASCGIERPLNSFLILKTQVGAQYGNICASCRQVQAKQDNPAKQDIDDASGTVDRHTIDNKTMVAIERDKKKQQKETETRDFEESIQTEEEKNLALEKKTTINAEEKKHRQAFLDSKPIKQSLVRTKEQPLSQKNQDQQSHLIKDTQQKEHEKTQQEINELNLNTSLSGPTDRLKHQSTTFKHFLAWAGEGSSIAKNLAQLSQKHLSGQQKAPLHEPTIDELTKNINLSGSRKK